MSRFQSGNSVFLSGGDRDLFVKVQLGSQASSGVEAWNPASLLNCPSGFMVLVEFSWGICAFSTGSAQETGLPSCCEGILIVPFEPVQGNHDLSRAEGALSVLFP